MHITIEVGFVELLLSPGYNWKMFWLIILLTVASGLLSLFGAFLLAIKKNWQMAFSLQMTAFSSGVLLATAFLHFAPEAIERSEASGSVFLTFQVMLLAIIFFFVLERLVLWYHHHHSPHGPKPEAYLVMVGDSLHNFIDGVLIASATLIKPELGILTALAVAAHELPQEIADFSVMVASGVSRQKALIYNVLSSLTAVVGAVLVYLAVPSLSNYLFVTLAFSAGMFIYIALSDLIPELHQHTKDTRQKWFQLGLLLVGIALIVVMSTVIPEAHLE